MKADQQISNCGLAISFRDQELILSPDKAFFWKEERTLILSDLHLGKAAHFRKHGVPVPRSIHISDLQRLNALVETFLPRQIVFLGDLFHSESNEEWDDFVHWSHFQKKVTQVLVRGNHDILGDAAYAQSRLQVEEVYELPPFSFSHSTVASSLYNLSGHIHPGIRLMGQGRQGMRLPCFYFGETHGLMPAFGDFTGSYCIHPQPGDAVYVVADTQVVEVF